MSSSLKLKIFLRVGRPDLRERPFVVPQGGGNVRVLRDLVFAQVHAQAGAVVDLHLAVHDFHVLVADLAAPRNVRRHGLEQEETRGRSRQLERRRVRHRAARIVRAQRNVVRLGDGRDLFSSVRPPAWETSGWM